MGRGPQVQAIKGMNDIFGEDARYFQFLESTADDLFTEYGYSQMRTPILEPTELFYRSVGESSDIVVNKQMYTFVDAGERSNTMRPEGTAGVIRSVIEHGLLKEQPVQKLWYHGPMFRYEKPQKGRLRQFNQIGIEVFGIPTPAADAEVILLCAHLLKLLGFKDVIIKLNNLGDPEDRKKYNEALRDILLSSKAQWCEQCVERARINPMRVFDCKIESCRELVKTLPRINEFANKYACTHFKTVTDILEACGIKWELDTELVRGLDYYCRTVFEVIQIGTGAQSAVAGGGRYDNLVEELGGPAICGVGMAIGVERLIIAMKSQGLRPPPETVPFCYCFANDEPSLVYMFSFVEKVRSKRKDILFDLHPRSFKAGLKNANRCGAKLVAIAGSAEITERIILIKSLATGNQEKLSFDAAIKYLVDYCQ